MTLFNIILLFIVINILYGIVQNQLLILNNQSLNKHFVFLNFNNKNNEKIYFVIYKDHYYDIYNYLNFNNKTAVLVNRKVYTDYELNNLTNTLNNFDRKYINNTIIFDMNNNDYINNIYDL